MQYKLCYYNLAQFHTHDKHLMVFISDKKFIYIFIIATRYKYISRFEIWNKYLKRTCLENFIGRDNHFGFSGCAVSIEDRSFRRDSVM